MACEMFAAAIYSMCREKFDDVYLCAQMDLQAYIACSNVKGRRKTYYGSFGSDSNISSWIVDGSIGGDGL